MIAVENKVINKILAAFKRNVIPWKTPWLGAGKNIGAPRNMDDGKKFSGINVLLLQMAAAENGYVNQWWGSNGNFYGKPTQIIVDGEFIEVYNAQQLANQSIVAKPVDKPNFKLASHTLHATGVNIYTNDKKEALYYYPPEDYITLPHYNEFANGIGGPQGYYETLAHELMHWTEARLHWNDDVVVNELRAEIGAAFLMVELGVPHSIANANFKFYRKDWINLLRDNEDILFYVADSACYGVDYIMSFTKKIEKRSK